MAARASSDVITNLSHLLPTGTFLAFQSLAPLFTNNGDCRAPEKIVTGILLFLFFGLCFGLSFTDSITTDTGKVYYGLVTKKGLYNQQFNRLKLPGDSNYNDPYFTGGDDLEDQYKASFTDFVNGILNVIAFGTLSCLTPPITTCYYPNISSTIVKTGPVLAAIIVGALFAVFPSGRHGVGYSLSTSGAGLVETLPASKKDGSADSAATDGGFNSGEKVAPTDGTARLPILRVRKKDGQTETA